MIFITCALHCEAKPIIERYKLSVDRASAFSVFKNDEIVLVVTGLGKILMASAMAYVYARYQEPKFSAWLNVGVAGKKEAAIGDFFNINKITALALENEKNINWYPVRLPELNSSSCPLITLDKPSESYKEGVAFDMETSAFMLMALRFSPVELVQVVKVISDNESTGIEAINKSFVTELIFKRLENVEQVVNALLVQSDLFCEEYSPDTMLEQCLSQWRFSEYQKKQLPRILQQWVALDAAANITQLECLSSAKLVVEYILKKLSSECVEFKMADVDNVRGTKK